MNRERLYLLIALLLTACLACSPARLATYRTGAETALNDPVSRPDTARSVIFFIGDGMGPQIVSIAKIYSEQSLGTDLNMVRLANTGTTGYMTTHSADRLVTDSAASGTAMATGVRTNNGVVGMTPDGMMLRNLFEEAGEQGKSVGVVTTAAVTDATPASFLAHAMSRQWHFDIAQQIVEGDATVVMGGGYWYFLPPERGRRNDGKDLMEQARQHGFETAFDKQELEVASGARLLGLFAADVMPYERERRISEVPSLSEMVIKALEVLETDPDGFILVVEGGRIDHAEHENQMGDALADFFVFDAAIGHAMEYQKDAPALTIIVTGDHETAGPAITGRDYGYPTHGDLDSITDDDCPFIAWTSGQHTGTMVPVFAGGPGAERFAGIKHNTATYENIVGLLGL
jgi:alkaline phosphatase